MSKARVFLAIVGGVHHFIDEHPDAAIPLIKAALATVKEILDARVEYEQREQTDRQTVFSSLVDLEERLAKLEKGRPS